MGTEILLEAPPRPAGPYPDIRVGGEVARGGEPDRKPGPAEVASERLEGSPGGHLRGDGPNGRHLENGLGQGRVGRRLSHKGVECGAERP